MGNYSIHPQGDPSATDPLGSFQVLINAGRPDGEWGEAMLEINRDDALQLSSYFAKLAEQLPKVGKPPRQIDPAGLKIEKVEAVRSGDAIAELQLTTACGRRLSITPKDLSGETEPTLEVCDGVFRESAELLTAAELEELLTGLEIDEAAGNALTGIVELYMRPGGMVSLAAIGAADPQVEVLEIFS